jgi:hypothetical protein
MSFFFLVLNITAQARRRDGGLSERLQMLRILFIKEKKNCISLQMSCVLGLTRSARNFYQIIEVRIGSSRHASLC